MSIDNSQVEVIINSIINMNEKMHIMEKRFQTKVESLEKENRHLYKQIEVLTEINTRNEMEKEDKKSVINRLLSRVKTNITKLFENDKNIDEDITTLFQYNEDNDENITTLFQNNKDLGEYIDENDVVIKNRIKIIQENIRTLFENFVVVENKIKTIDTNIDICFENFKRNDIDREEMFEYDETNDQEIKANIKLLFEKDKINEKKIRKLFNNCELYKKQIEILFDNDNDN